MCYSQLLSPIIHIRTYIGVSCSGIHPQTITTLLTKLFIQQSLYAYYVHIYIDILLPQCQSAMMSNKSSKRQEKRYKTKNKASEEVTSSELKDKEKLMIQLLQYSSTDSRKCTTMHAKNRLIVRYIAYGYLTDINVA